MFLFQELSYDLAMTGSQGRLMLLHIPGRYLKGQVKTSTVRYSGLKQAYCSDRKDVLLMRVALIYLHACTFCTCTYIVICCTLIINIKSGLVCLNYYASQIFPSNFSKAQFLS